MASNQRISQETFDAAVKENMEEFDMEADEAISDAVRQFESQGVDLTNIIKGLPSSKIMDSSGKPTVQRHPVLVALEIIKESLSCQPLEEDKLLEGYKQFQQECNQGLAYRSVAGANGAYPILLKACQVTQDNTALLNAALLPLIALIDGQPDLINNDGIQFLTDTLKTYSNDAEIQEKTIYAIRLACMMHEGNRQKFVSCNLIKLLTAALHNFKEQISVIKEACSALRVLTFDDDIRVPFGKAHEHAKLIVSESNTLALLIGILKIHYQDITIYGEICATLSKLAVRNEFCQEIVDLGGLTLISRALAERPDQQLVAARSCSLLRAISGNDDVKAAIMKTGVASLVIVCMDRHQRQAQIAEQGCGALASLALRHPQHCTEIMSASGVDVILRAMKIHENVEGVQKQGCMAIRNLVARNREYCDAVLQAGAEAIIRNAARNHKNCGDESKAALRDLGCSVQLRELWTGLPKSS